MCCKILKSNNGALGNRLCQPHPYAGPFYMHTVLGDVIHYYCLVIAFNMRVYIYVYRYIGNIQMSDAEVNE